MPRPRYKLVRDAERNIEVLMRDIDVEQRRLVERIHALVIRGYDVSNSRLFGVYGYGKPGDSTLAARSALTILFRQMQQLQLEVKWVAGYLGRDEDDIELYENAAVTLLRDFPDGSFSRTFKIICKDIGVDVPGLLS